MSVPADNLPAIHPGEILKDDLDALDMSARQFARHIKVPANAITEILNGDRRVTAAMALRLGKAFGTDPRYWLNLQAQYDTKLARDELGKQLDAIEMLPPPDVTH